MQEQEQTRRKEDFAMRPIEARDNEAIAVIIRETLEEYGGNKPGFAYTDPEVDAMYETYNKPDALYLVVEYKGEIVGGGGVSQLKGDAAGVCELQKMYFRPECRGMGLGAQLLERCLQFARDAGYKGMYLETMTEMEHAQRLYRRFGFEERCQAMGATGHCGCDRKFYRTLD